MNFSLSTINVKLHNNILIHYLYIASMPHVFLQSILWRQMAILMYDYEKNNAKLN